MALFKFVGLREGLSAPSTDLALVLDVQSGERLIGRRLRGAGMWDAGRELFKIVIPGRLPLGLDLTADDDLYGVLDRQAPNFRYGEAHREISRVRLGAAETVALTRPHPDAGPIPSLDSADEEWDQVPDPQPVALLVFFPQPLSWRLITRAWRRVDGLLGVGHA